MLLDTTLPMKFKCTTYTPAKLGNNQTSYNTDPPYATELMLTALWKILYRDKRMRFLKYVPDIQFISRVSSKTGMLLEFGPLIDETGYRKKMDYGVLEKIINTEG